MSNTYIEFKKQRDLGEVLGDTFAFIRVEFKKFIAVFFKICGPFVVALMLAIGFYTYSLGDLVIDPFSDRPYGSVSFFVFFSALSFYLLSLLLAYMFSIGTTLFYIKSYIDNRGEVIESEVQSQVYKSFWSLFGLSFLRGITLIFAMMLCFLPVLYVMVPMAVVFSIYVFQPKSSAIDAYSESFYLVNQDFWLAFGVILVLGIIYFAVSFTFGFISGLYGLVEDGVIANEIDPTEMNYVTDPIYILINVLSSLFQFFLNIIFYIGGAFVYFHLNEKKNFTGTYERIARIGENPEE